MGLKDRVTHALRRHTTGPAESSRLVEQSLHRITELEEMTHDLTSSLLYSRWMDSPNVLASRREVGYWLNWLGLTGLGVEVGVFKGEFSRVLLRTWWCSSLVSVDPWREFPKTEYMDTCNLSQSDHDLNFQATTEVLRPFGRRSNILRTTSHEAAGGIEDSKLDFVYLDAQHHYEAVKEDLELWHPKLKRGGVLGGHDYLDGRLESGLYGVKKAVDEFVAIHGYTIILTDERDWPSWFVRIV